MPLNPFFLQGSASEQRLVQDLVNEQLRMYGIEVYYLPREIKNRKEVFQEVQSSDFDDNFLIEAYVPPELIMLILNFFKVLRRKVKFSLLETEIKAFLTFKFIVKYFFLGKKYTFLYFKIFIFNGE